MIIFCKSLTGFYACDERVAFGIFDMNTYQFNTYKYTINITQWTCYQMMYYHQTTVL